MIFSMIIQGSASASTEMDDLLKSAWKYQNGMTRETWRLGSHPKDLDKARGLYQEARALGSGEASFALHYMTTDRSEAKALHLEAVQRGYKQAIFSLATKYLTGTRDFPKNLKKAERLANIVRPEYEKKRIGGAGWASYKLHQLETPGSAFSKALLIEAAERGYQYAKIALAKYQKEGNFGFENNFEEAKRWAQSILEERSVVEDARLVLEKKMELCNKSQKKSYKVSHVNGIKKITSKGKFGSITATKNKQGKWDGPYKYIRNDYGDDCFVVVDGVVKNNVFSGTLYHRMSIRMGYDFYRAMDKGTFVLKYKPTINVDEAMNSGFELYDYELSKKYKGQTITQKVIVKNNKMVSMTEYLDDGTVLYEGKVVRPNGAYFNKYDYFKFKNQNIKVKKVDESKLSTSFGKEEDMIFFTRPVNFGRSKGKCLYENTMELCNYDYYVEIKNSSRYNRYKRIDPIGQKRRAHFLALLNGQIRGNEIKYNRSKSKWAAEDRKKAEKKRKEQELVRRNKENKKRWTREKAESKRRIQQDQARMFNQTFDGGTSNRSSSDINDPLNLNNPINRRMQQQTQRALRDHANKQAQAKSDYQAKLVQRQREIEAQKKASLERRLAKQRKRQQGQTNNSSQSSNTRGLSVAGSTRNSSPTTTHKPFMTSKVEDQYAKGKDGWDCVNNWQAAKCGDRMTTHTIHPMSPGITGQGKKIDKHSTSASQSGSLDGSTVGNTSGSNNNNSTETGGTDTSKSKKKKEAEAVKSPKQLKGDSDSYFYNKSHAIDLAQTEIMNKASKYCGNGYRSKLTWHNNLAQCKKLNEQFRCNYQAKVTCLSEDCSTRFCGTGR